MVNDPLLFSFFLIFTGAAIISTLALQFKQPLLVAYILLGVILGPSGFSLISDASLLAEISHFGILFLLFLLGLDMQPISLLHTLKKTVFVTLASSILFSLTGYTISIAFGFNHIESTVIGLSMMFSSTIIGIKLLPTTVLHHRRMGELMVGILLLQDFIAIFVLLYLKGQSVNESSVQNILQTILSVPLLIGFAFFFVRYVLLRLIAKFDHFKEYIFLLSIGWCLGMAELADFTGLSSEIGAFIAGVSIATSPIAQYIALSLKPLRDFFLILFFFSLGAQFDLSLLGQLIMPALTLGTVMLLLKPISFRYLLHKFSERKRLAWDAGLRLGQISEFSLLIAYVAANNSVISDLASHLIQATAIITFLVSSYVVVFFCPSPIGVSEKLRRD